MKNLDTLMSEDKDATIRMLVRLYDIKTKTFKKYLHMLALFVIASLLLVFICDELKSSSIYAIGIISFTLTGCYLTHKAHKDAFSYKLLIKKYT